MRRCHEAKHNMQFYNQQIQIKDDFFKDMLSTPHSTSPTLEVLIRFLQGRLNNLQLIMDRSMNHQKLIDELYETVVESGLNQQQTGLNHIMKALTMITVTFLPFSTISGFFGMNVQVPWQQDYKKNYGAFIGIVIFCACFSTFLICMFKRLQWF